MRKFLVIALALVAIAASGKIISGTTLQNEITLTSTNPLGRAIARVAEHPDVYAADLVDVTEIFRAELAGMSHADYLEYRWGIHDPEYRRTAPKFEIPLISGGMSYVDLSYNQLILIPNNRFGPLHRIVLQLQRSGENVSVRKAILQRQTPSAQKRGQDWSAAQKEPWKDIPDEMR